MSIRAYIVTETNTITVDGKEYTHEETEYLYNLWQNPEITELLFKGFADDYTNDDFCGEICISVDQWDDFKEAYIENDIIVHINQIKMTIHEVVQEHKEVFQTIDAIFKQGNWEVILKCY